MRLIKSLVVCGLALVFSAQSFAAVMELNNQNAAQCRRQILTSPSKNVVVAAYYSSCHWWQSFKPNYDSVANSLNYPASYYRFDFLAAAPGVAASCLQAQPRYSPTLFVYSKSKKQYSLVRSKSGYQNVNQVASFVRSAQQG